MRHPPAAMVRSCPSSRGDPKSPPLPPEAERRCEDDAPAGRAASSSHVARRQRSWRQSEGSGRHGSLAAWCSIAVCWSRGERRGEERHRLLHSPDMVRRWEGVNGLPLPMRPPRAPASPDCDGCLRQGGQARGAGAASSVHSPVHSPAHPSLLATSTLEAERACTRALCGRWPKPAGAQPSGSRRPDCPARNQGRFQPSPAERAPAEACIPRGGGRAAAAAAVPLCAGAAPLLAAPQQLAGRLAAPAGAPGVAGVGRRAPVLAALAGGRSVAPAARREGGHYWERAGRRAEGSGVARPDTSRSAGRNVAGWPASFSRGRLPLGWCTPASAQLTNEGEWRAGAAGRSGREGVRAQPGAHLQAAPSSASAAELPPPKRRVLSEAAAGRG